MAYDRVKNTVLSHGITDVISDFVRLVKAELRLAQAEVAFTIREKMQAAIWLAFAGLFGLVALIFVGQGVVSLLIERGMQAPAANTIVALVGLVLTVFFVLIGVSKAKKGVTPSRTVRQVKQDIHAVKEKLT
jgi:hypothetical protein